MSKASSARASRPRSRATQRLVEAPPPPSPASSVAQVTQPRRVELTRELVELLERWDQQVALRALEPEDIATSRTLRALVVAHARGDSTALEAIGRVSHRELRRMRRGLGSGAWSVPLGSVGRFDGDEIATFDGIATRDAPEPGELSNRVVIVAAMRGTVAWHLERNADRVAVASELAHHFAGLALAPWTAPIFRERGIVFAASQYAQLAEQVEQALTKALARFPRTHKPDAELLCVHALKALGVADAHARALFDASRHRERRAVVLGHPR